MSRTYAVVFAARNADPLAHAPRARLLFFVFCHGARLPMLLGPAAPPARVPRAPPGPAGRKQHAHGLKLDVRRATLSLLSLSWHRFTHFERHRRFQYVVVVVSSHGSPGTEPSQRLSSRLDYVAFHIAVSHRSCGAARRCGDPEPHPLHHLYPLCVCAFVSVCVCSATMEPPSIKTIEEFLDDRPMVLAPPLPLPDLFPKDRWHARVGELPRAAMQSLPGMGVRVGDCRAGRSCSKFYRCRTGSATPSLPGEG